MTHGSSENTVLLEQLLHSGYGLDGELERLLGERDRNYRLTCSDGERYIVKIVDSGETAAVSDFQIRALLHLQANACSVPVPRIIALKSGAYAARLDDDDGSHIVRVVSYLPGVPMSGFKTDRPLAHELGAALARLDLALRDFDHSCDRRDFIWDMQNAALLRERTHSISDAAVRDMVIGCLEDFDKQAQPRFDSLRTQVIHNDVNPANVLLSGDPAAVSGIIDFSDMVTAPLIIEVATAASYLRSGGRDALSLLAPFVAGYHAVCPLQEAEWELLYDLVCTRLTTTITKKHWRAATVAESDPSLLQAVLEERDAEDFLGRLRSAGSGAFRAQIRAYLSDL